ncbi:hypothetical protein B0H14DRAFT_2573876 [Mycena olivaceomarginata]|nr:hypothetical protein B0H14DRAFT_2573876 [Mycena olivaceomarginata]
MKNNMPNCLPDIDAVVGWLWTLLPTSSYLFLCTVEDLQPDIPGIFQIPDYPTYWSTDPAGVARLTANEAKAVGFPSIRMEMIVEGMSWDSSIYAGLEQFHRGKGFVEEHKGSQEDEDLGHGEDSVNNNGEDQSTDGESGVNVEES